MKKQYSFTLDQKEVEQFKKDNPAINVSAWINEQIKQANRKDK